MASGARKLFGAFEKRAPGPIDLFIFIAFNKLAEVPAHVIRP